MQEELVVTYRDAVVGPVWLPSRAGASFQLWLMLRGWLTRSCAWHLGHVQWCLEVGVHVEDVVGGSGLRFFLRTSNVWAHALISVIVDNRARASFAF